MRLIPSPREFVILPVKQSHKKNIKKDMSYALPANHMVWNLTPKDFGEKKN